MHTPENVNKEIYRLALPNIVSNFSIPLLGAVDTALMGRLESEHYLGAVGIGGVIFSFIYWGFGFLRMTTTGLTAQAFGGKRYAGMWTLTSTSNIPWDCVKRPPFFFPMAVCRCQFLPRQCEF